MRKSLTNQSHFIVVLILLVWAGGCAVRERKVELQGSTPAPPTPNAEGRQPTIAASPVEEGADGWLVSNADAVTLTVKAPGASEVALRYRPVVADEQDGYLQLKKLTTPSEGEGGEFRADISTPEDFAGEVWAQVTYPDGARKQTGRIALTTRTATGETETQSTSQEAGDPAEQQDANGASVGEDESARSDKATGGRVTRASLRPYRPDIRITVNVPAFLLTLWQDGKEVATYPVGVGRKAFPIPVGERRATQIILNPAWVPPDSSWVRASGEVEPYERIPADDPRNPLGKIKIPLGDAYLIHEAARPSDIGSLVSHGCVRMLTDDLFDLTERIARARSLDITGEEIEKARGDGERRVLRLEEPLPVDINYDTEVVEGGVLYVYPDVYDRETNTVERLREDLRAAGVDVSKLDDETLRQMIVRANMSEKFVVRINDFGRGRALAAGRTEPLVKSSDRERKKGAGKG
ncbi:MAG TPA: L,D-transpeptidase [Pyrinomonadaceae bacterium]|nr:L,D-transpeptidase [Pyrinomonadaceae bacterium]